MAILGTAVLDATEAVSVHRGAAQPVGQRSHGRRTATLCCLVVSEKPTRRTVLVAAAADAGFEPIVCEDLAHAWVLSRRDELHFALMDLVGLQDQPMAKDFGEHLARDRRILVAVCGEEAEPLQEIWARQVGAWLYLPGLVDREGLAGVCSEARPVIDRMMNQ